MQHCTKKVEREKNPEKGWKRKRKPTAVTHVQSAQKKYVYKIKKRVGKPRTRKKKTTYELNKKKRGK